MMKNISALLLLVLCPFISSAQVYSARTDLNAQAYPSPLPCPSSAGCSGGGALTGANYSFTPTDFKAEMTRITDVNTGVALGGARHDAFSVTCSDSMEINFMNVLDNRFSICDSGNSVHTFTWNASTLTATESYLDGNALLQYFWSFTQNYVAYSIRECNGTDMCLVSMDFTTATSPVNTTLVDLTSSCGAPSWGGWAQDLTVSRDDQTFADALSSTSGQGSSGAVYMTVWNRTNGCRLYNTGTGTITGAYGGAPTGSIVGTSDEYTLHNARISLDGNWVRTDVQTCNSGLCNSTNAGEYYWQIATLNVTPLTTSDPGYTGHQAMGYSHWANQSGTNGQPPQEVLMRPFTNLATDTALLTDGYPAGCGGSGSECDTHLGWNNNSSGSSDTAPIFSVPTTSAFTPVYAWDNEILAYSTTGNGTVWRFAHDYDSQTSALGVLGVVSQDGKWFAWDPDWDGMLGNTNLTSSSCTLGTNCRVDVFMMNLPISNSNSAPLPPTDLTATVE
jgi:hypothetical protein